MVGSTERIRVNINNMNTKRDLLRFALKFVLIVSVIGIIDYYIETQVINWIPIIFLVMASPGAIILQSLTFGHCFIAIMSAPPTSCFLNDSSISCVVIILDLIFYFIVGLIIGWLYSKIKNKNVV